MGYRFKHKTKNYKTLRDNIGEDLQDLEVSKEFLGMTSKAQSIKEGGKKINKLDLVKVKNMCSTKDRTERRRPATDREKIFANHLSDEGLYLEYTKNCQHPTVKQINKQSD